MKLLLLTMSFVCFGLFARSEYVLLEATFDCDNKAIISRKNGEKYVIEKGVGCLSLDWYVGQYIIINSPGIFLGVGSSIVLPDRNQSCRIWNSEQIR